MTQAYTLFDKIWDRHLISETDEGDSLLYVDRCLIHEGSSHCFEQLAGKRRTVLRPEQIFAFSDHYVPTTNRELGVAGATDEKIRAMIELLAENCTKHAIRLYGIDDPQQGILHVVPPELGLTQPGLMMVGADSHTSTHGAFGTIAMGIGASETTHVLATQTLWQRRPETFRITVNGPMPLGIGAKDIILSIIARIGAGGGTAKAIEYTGSAIDELSMEGRMTLCNMSIEAGSRAGLIAPDQKTFDYMAGREFAPQGQLWEEAMAFWRELPTDPGAHFAHELTFEASEVAPMVSWGTSPQHADFIGAAVPLLESIDDADERGEVAAALDYMGLQPGTLLSSIAIDQVFIGSCTNGRIEDLRAAAAVAARGRARVPTWVVPGSRAVKAQAEREGLDEIFLDSGFEWRDPGCSLCTAINGDEVAAGKRCASTSNRNFRGRQGRGARTHLVSPAMAAAAAITGHLTDVRTLGGEDGI